MKNKITWFALCVLVVSVVLIGCGGGGGGSSSPVGPTVSSVPVANLSGIVSLSGQPLSDAAVYLYSSDKALQAGVSNLPSLRGSILEQTKLADGSYFTKTDSVGHYSFNDIPVGEYTLIAVKDEAHQYAQTGVMLGSVTTADAQLTPTGKVTGRVQLSTGQAVAGAIVHLEKTSYVSISDANGDFALTLPAGQTFSLGVVTTQGNLAAPVSVSVTPAETKSLGTIALVIPTTQVANITGSVTAADSTVPTAALAGRIVILTSSDPSPLVAMTDSAGGFNLAVRKAGSYSLSVVGGEYAVSPTMQTVNVTALGSTVPVGQPFVLSKPAVPTTPVFTVSGTLSKTSFVNSETDHSGVTVALTSTSGAASTYTGITNSAGAYTLSVPTGNYTVSLISSSYKPDAGMPVTVNVTANQTLAAFNVSPLTTPAQLYTVGGTALKTQFVNGESTHVGVTVALTPTSGAATTFTALTDAVGSFSLNVPAGNYKVSIISSSYRGGAGMPLTVTVGANLVLATFNVQPAGEPISVYTVTGTALKNPMVNGDTTHAGVTISLTSTSGSADTYTGVTDTAGAFSINVPAGNYSLSIISSSYRAGAGTPTTFSVSGNYALGSFNLNPVAAPVQRYTVGGTANKNIFVDGETTHAGVTITLTPTSGEAVTYSAVTDAVGSFSIEVPAGSYRLSVISSLYKPAGTLPGPVAVSANMVLATFNLSPINTQPALYSVGGTALKSLFVDGETDHSALTVTLSPTSGSGNTYSAVTDAVGSYSINVPAGSYNLSVISSRYKLASAIANPITVTANRFVPNFTLDPITAPVSLYSVGGTALKSLFVDGETDHSALTVTLSPTSGSGNTYSAVTDTVGSYSINVPAGSYNLSVISSRYKLASAIANPITVTANRFVPNFTLNPITAPVTLYSVGGTALKSLFVDGETDHSALTVTLSPTSGSGNTYSAVTDTVGSYSINVPAGSYNLSVISSRYKLASAIANPITVTANRFVPNFTLNPITAPVTLYSVGGTALKSLFVDGETDHSALTVTLSPTSGGGNTYSAVTDAVGSFSINVPAGSYNLSVISSRYKLASAIANPITVTANRFVPNFTLNPISPPVTFYTIGGTALKNLFLDGEVNHSGVTVALTPVSGDATTYTGVTDNVGSFSIQVPAGNYNISVISSLYKPAVALANPVIANVSKVLNTFNLIPVTPPNPLYSVSGTALKTVFVNGEATHDGITVTLTATSGSAQTYSAVTGSGGAFSLQVPAGTYSLTVISSLYKLVAAVAPVVVTNANVSLASFNVAPINPPVLQYYVEGRLNKTAFIEGDSVNSNGAVVVTLTSTSATPRTYDTVTDSSGYFKMTVAPDTYNLGVSSGYKFSSVRTPYDVTAGNVTISPALSIEPMASQMFSLSGSVSKSMFKPGDSSNGDVNIVLRPETAGMQVQFAVTDSYGNFNFKVPNGNYAIEIGSGYTYVSPPAAGTYPHTVAGSDLAVSAVAIAPDASQKGIVRGSISPAVSTSCTVRLKAVSPGTFVDLETTAAGDSQFAFYNVPVGTYTLMVMPTGNGYYAYSGEFALAAGEDVSILLPTSFVAPAISTVSVSEQTLDLLGSNFDPTTSVIHVDGIRVARPAVYSGATTTSDAASIVSVAPGRHAVTIQADWVSPDTSEVFSLRSAGFEFVKSMGSPVAPSVSSITDSSAVVSWGNAKFTQKSVIKVMQGVTEISSAEVEGNSYRVTGLTASTTYTIDVYNKFGDILSAAVSTPAFTTHRAGTAGASVTTLAGTNAILSNPMNKIFGFELMNDRYYIAYYDTTSASEYVYVKAFGLDGTEIGTGYSVAYYPLSDPENFDMCVGAGNVYLTYYDTNGYQQVVSLAGETLVQTGIIDFSTIGFVGVLIRQAKTEFHGGRLYVSAFLPGDVSTIELRCMNPDFSSPQSVYISSVSNSITITDGYWLMTAADEDADELFIAVAYSIGGLIVDACQIVKKTLSNPTGTSSVVADIDATKFPSVNAHLKEFSIHGSNLLVTSTYGEYVKISRDGLQYFQFYSTISDLTSCCSDAQNKQWSFYTYILPSTGTNSYILNLEGNQIVKSFPIGGLPSYAMDDTLAHVAPGEFIKMQKIGKPGIIGALHVTDTAFLGVLTFDSSF